MEKSGFVYIWFDRKHKMYYIGCHWGHFYDGYICSSNRMRDAYRRRPEDFKRRILTTNIQSKTETFLEENRWLVMISPKELGEKYYNYRNYSRIVSGPIKGTHSAETKRIISEKLRELYKNPELRKKVSTKTKEAMHRPEIIIKRENWLSSDAFIQHKKDMSICRTGSGNPMFGKIVTEETRENLRQINTGRKHSPETRIIMSQNRRGIPNKLKGIPRTEETKRKIREGVLARNRSVARYSGNL